MEADLDRPAPARTPEPHGDTGTSTATPDRVSDAEAFDHLQRLDPSRPVSPSAGGAMARWRGDDVRWVRACDALAQTSGKATGRGIIWTTQANRLSRLAPLHRAGTGRRAIARASATPRASNLAPLDAFGVRPDSQPPAARTGVSR